MPVPAAKISLDEAVELARTGDVWLFRGRTVADRAIQVSTNSPVNHVGMTVAIDDLPPLMWHAELGRSLPDLWTGTHHRGVQLHDLRAAVVVWGNRYGQRAWLRQLIHPELPLAGAAGRELEDAVLRTIARFDGVPFPSTARLATRWLRNRGPVLPGGRWPIGERRQRGERQPGGGQPGGDDPHSDGLRPDDAARRGSDLETAYCAEVVAATYQAMGLLPRGRLASWYDPGRFWSGDALDLAGGFHLGGEIAVSIPG